MEEVDFFLAFDCFHSNLGVFLKCRQNNACSTGDLIHSESKMTQNPHKILFSAPFWKKPFF